LIGTFPKKTSHHYLIALNGSDLKSNYVTVSRKIEPFIKQISKGSLQWEKEGMEKWN
jgi:hypothetical protein